MKVSQYTAENNLSERQYRDLKAAFKKAYPNTEMLRREGSKTFLITEEAKPLLDALLPPKRNTEDDTKNIEVLTGELVEYDYSDTSNSNALTYGNSNVKASHLDIIKLTETLSLTSELFERIDEVIDTHKNNLTAQENAIEDVNTKLELKITEVREKLLQVQKAEVKAKTRIETGTTEASKKHQELSSLLSEFASHLA